jgi:hypothetical protein
MTADLFLVVESKGKASTGFPCGDWRVEAADLFVVLKCMRGMMNWWVPK